MEYIIKNRPVSVSQAVIYGKACMVATDKQSGLKVIQWGDVAYHLTQNTEESLAKRAAHQADQLTPSQDRPAFYYRVEPCEDEGDDYGRD